MGWGAGDRHEDMLVKGYRVHLKQEENIWVTMCVLGLLSHFYGPVIKQICLMDVLIILIEAFLYIFITYTDTQRLQRCVSG